MKKYEIGLFDVKDFLDSYSFIYNTKTQELILSDFPDVLSDLFPKNLTLADNDFSLKLKETFDLVKKYKKKQYFDYKLLDSEYLVLCYNSGLKDYYQGLLIGKEHSNELIDKILKFNKYSALVDLIGGLVHDFNNHLMIMSGNCQILEMNEVSDYQNKHIRRIKESIKSCNELSRNILKLSNRNSCENFKDEDLILIIKDAVTLLESILKHKAKIEFITQLETAIINCKYSEILNCIINVIKNAGEAIDSKGKIVVSLEMEYIEEKLDKCSNNAINGTYYVLKVRDNGCGIKKENLANVTEPFFTTKSSTNGMGLGLASIVNLVKEQNMLFEIESIYGEGTLISLYIKAKQEINENKIIVVDDDESILSLVCEFLEELRYDVKGFNNPKDALKFCKSELPSIVISDYQMPELDGIQLYSMLKEINPNVNFILMTGYTGDLKVDGIKVLEKPLDLRVLSDSIKNNK